MFWAGTPTLPSFIFAHSLTAPVRAGALIGIPRGRSASRRALHIVKHLLFTLRSSIYIHMHRVTSSSHSGMDTLAEAARVAPAAAVLRKQDRSGRRKQGSQRAEARPERAEARPERTEAGQRPCKAHEAADGRSCICSGDFSGHGSQGGCGCGGGRIRRIGDGNGGRGERNHGGRGTGLGCCSGIQNECRWLVRGRGSGCGVSHD